MWFHSPLYTTLEATARITNLQKEIESCYSNDNVYTTEGNGIKYCYSNDNVYTTEGN